MLEFVGNVTVMSLCRKVDGFLECEVDGEILLLDTESNLIHQLNRTASFIWRKYEEGASFAEIAEALAKDFEVEEDKVQADVKRTVGELAQLGLKRKR